MKYIDINRKFTDAVNSYLAQGYILNSTTMSGSEGEIAHIDLTNGSEVIRIFLREFSDFVETDGGVELIVGRASADVIPNEARERQTIWNGKLEVISHEAFYKLNGYRGNDFYGTKEEAKAASEKRLNRHIGRMTDTTPKDVTEKAAPVVKKYVREKFNIRRIKMDSIKVTKQNGVYTVAYNGYRAQLH